MMVWMTIKMVWLMKKLMIIHMICTSSLGLVGRKRDSYTKEEEKNLKDVFWT